MNNFTINDNTLKSVYLIMLGAITVTFIKMLEKFRER